MNDMYSLTQWPNVWGQSRVCQAGGEEGGMLGRIPQNLTVFLFLSPLQAGMTAPGTRRAIYDQKLGTEKCDNSTMSLQMGYRDGANQSGQNFGLGRQIYDAKYCPKATEIPGDENGAGVARDYIPDYQDEGYQGYQEEEQVYQDDGTDY